MFNKFFPNLCVKVNKLWAKLTKNDEVIDVMEKGSVKVNPTLAGTEELITGLDVEGTKYKNVKVEANPTLAGTEADLTGLQVGDTKYKVPSGSGDTKIYAHYITMSINGYNSLGKVNIVLITNSNEVSGRDAFWNYLSEVGYDINHPIACDGYHYNDTETKAPKIAYGIYKLPSETQAKLICVDTSENGARALKTVSLNKSDISVQDSYTRLL